MGLDLLPLAGAGGIAGIVVFVVIAIGAVLQLSIGGRDRSGGGGGFFGG